MANNYTQWCIGIEFASTEEKLWMQDMVLKLNNYAELYQDNPDPKESPGEFKELQELKEVLGPIAGTIDDFRDFVSFTVSYVGDEGKQTVYFESEEAADPAEIELLLQAYLKKFHPDKSISLSWASWCDKSRVNEFGGGGVFITATGISQMNSWEWLEEKEAEFKKQQLKVAKLAKKGAKKK